MRNIIIIEVSGKRTTGIPYTIIDYFFMNGYNIRSENLDQAQNREPWKRQKLSNPLDWEKTQEKKERIIGTYPGREGGYVVALR